MQKTFDVTSITGGITDEYIESEPRFVKHADNLCLDHSGDIVQRQGSHFLEGSDPRTGSFVSSNTPITHTAEFTFTNIVQNYLACVHNTGQSLTLKQLSGGAQTDFNFTMPTFTTHSGFNSSVWQAQPFFANSTVASGKGNYPTKITEDKAFQLNVISAGLPKPIENSKTGYYGAGPVVGITVGFNNIAQGSPDTSPYVGTAVAATVSQTPTSVSNEFRLACVYRRIYTINGVTYQDISAPYFIGYISNTGNLPVGITPGTSLALKIDVNDILIKETSGFQWQTNWHNTAYCSQSGDIVRQVYAGGTTYNKDLDKSGTIKISFYRTTGNGSVYYNAGIENVHRSNPNGGFVLEGMYGTVGTDFMFDLDFSANTPTYPLVGSVQTYRTTFTDTQLINQPTLYTTGGILPNDLPGRCKFNTLVNDNYMYWVDAENPYRVRQSAARDPDSVPTGNLIDFPDIITGISSAANKLIVCTLTATYRIDGFYDDRGGGSVIAERISSETGSISHNSMVRVGDGLFFCGIDGFYYTNGQTVIKVSRHLSATYMRLTQQIFAVDNTYLSSIVTVYGKKYKISENQSINGKYDIMNNRILWSFLDGAEVLVCEKAYGINEKMSFFGPWKLPTNKSGAANSSEVTYAKTLGTYINKIVRTDNLGNVFQLEDGVSSDPRPISLSATVPTNWLAGDRYPILYRLRTQSSYLGSSTQTKYATRMSAVFKRISAFFPVGNFFDRRLDVQITSINDNGRTVQDLKPAHYLDSKDSVYTKSKQEGELPYNANLQGYASSVSTYNSGFEKDNALIKITRRFAAKGLRCISRALEFKPALSLVAKSDSYATAVYAPGAVSITGGQIWSHYAYTGASITANTFIGSVASVDHSVEGYYISFDYDNYTALYPVTGVSGSGDTLQLGVTFLNYTGTAAIAGTYKWKLYAMPKNQFFGLCGFSISYSEMIDGENFYRLVGNSTDQGEP